MQKALIVFSKFSLYTEYVMKKRNTDIIFIKNIGF